MKVVALVSGGKDSCFNILQCVAAGHEIVALANLRPESNLRDELDSYMYQTVGHQGVDLYSEALGLPLFRHRTQGKALIHEKVYTVTPEDEVEDLYKLLAHVKEKVVIEAVAVGAVLSDYQRIRVENVCSRLGLVALAYLWRRDQAQLLQEMVDCNINAIIIKVAALGLDPGKHLGLRISEIQPHLVKMNEKYGLNICGEGGEYETFTLDCPLFSKSLVIDDSETVIHSNDAIAPVGYINFVRLRLDDKQVDEDLSFLERLAGLPIKNSLDYITDIDEEDIVDCDKDHEPNENETKDCFDQMSLVEPERLLLMREQEPVPDKPSIVRNSSGWCWIGGVTGTHTDSAQATLEALGKLCALLETEGMSPVDLVRVCMFVSSMADYAAVNAAYVGVLSHVNPPVRVCVEAPLPPECPIVLEATAHRRAEVARHTMHVQTISHWAPANIGPYSQAVRIGDVIYVAGQIALVPGSMQLVQGGIRRHSRLVLRHVDRVIRAMDPNTQIRDVVQGVCYVTNAAYIAEARREWERRTNNAITDYVVVPALPRGALLEWQVWAHRSNARFEYEETGCVIGDCRVSLRRRWNYDNTVAAVVCNVSSGSSASNPTLGNSPTAREEPLSESDLREVLGYCLLRLHRGGKRIRRTKMTVSPTRIDERGMFRGCVV
ncbi:uncharacterized protein LOC128984473 isoform X2 [Macrosteles quadrilineatus]|uniref:uncharacterized protein LOC128984473 isoform X2 n=1 Tax=Macrosteles quadrilineatus TaxID=74068 RepID=UPI0023E231AE|nr:uncharacterized protein LOC128984473 isoform X2 [Macrosteles quadrilineatus]